MKMILPNLRKSRRIYYLLEEFYLKNCHLYVADDFTQFNHAIIIFCAYYHMPKPHRIRFRRSFGHDKCVGKCYESGNIDIAYPYHYVGDCHKWIGVVYHELAHYYLWSNAEEKALEFELKMLKRK